MNLDLGIPTRFYNGLDSFSYIWLQFVFPFYLWILTAAIILAGKFSTRVMKLLGSNPVAVLATVILMSYTKLLRTSQEILSHVTIAYSNGVNENCWKLDPNVKYFERKHIPLVVFAISVIAILLAHTIFLTFGYHLQRFSGKKGFQWFNRLKPILDAFYAPYTKSARFWTGFLLLVRICLCIGNILTANKENIEILIAIPSILSFAILIPLLKNKIYEKTFMNLLEASFIFNMIILAAATYHVKKVKNSQIILTYISTGIAFVEFLGIMIFHVILQLQKAFSKKMNNNWIDLITRIKIKANQTVGKPNDIKEEKTRKVSTTLVDIREPLLEDYSTEL